MLEQEQRIIDNAILESYRNNALLNSAMECRKMIKNNKTALEAKSKIKTLGYIGESLNPHAIRRLTDESTIKEYELANENFISKVVDTSVRVIKSIIDAIVSAVKKIIEWISSLFGGGSNSNESKNKQVEKEIKDAKDKKESPKDDPPPARTPTPSAGPGIQTLIEENKANIIPDENNPYINYYLFGKGKVEPADPSSTLPYFADNEEIGYGYEGAIIADYAKICNAFVSSAKYVDNRIKDEDEIIKANKYMTTEYEGRGHVSLYGAASLQPWNLHKTSYFKADDVCYDLLYMSTAVTSSDGYLMIPPSVGIDYITIYLPNVIDRLDISNKIMSADHYLIDHNEDTNNEYNNKKFLQKHWNNDYSKLDDLIKNNYDEAGKIFEQSKTNINKMLEAYNKMLKEMPDKSDMDKLYNKSLAGAGFVSNDLLQCKNNYITTCLVIVFACIKQVSYEMRSVQKLSDAARSQGRYIANRRIQFNTEAA